MKFKEESFDGSEFYDYTIRAGGGFYKVQDPDGNVDVCYVYGTNEGMTFDSVGSMFNLNSMFSSKIYNDMNKLRGYKFYPLEEESVFRKVQKPHAE